MDVFVVQHVHEAPNGEEDVKLIGVYSAERAAHDAVVRLRSQPGFCEQPENFHIDRYELDRDHWEEGFISWAEANESP